MRERAAERRVDVLRGRDRLDLDGTVAILVLELLEVVVRDRLAVAVERDRPERRVEADAAERGLVGGRIVDTADARGSAPIVRPPTASTFGACCAIRRPKSQPTR